MKRGGTLISVAAELIASAAEVAAFPDSDDDESDDEAEGSAGSLRSGQQRLTGTVYTMKHYAEEGARPPTRLPAACLRACLLAFYTDVQN